MALIYVHGKWLHDRAVKDRDPVAIMVTGLWSAEHDARYQSRRREVVDIIGRRCWNLLYATRPLVGKEAFYRAVYDAIYTAGQRLPLPPLPAL